MDLDYFEEILKNIKLDNQKIKMVAEYCLNNNFNNQYEIARIIDKYFTANNNPNIKAAILYVVSQIFRVSNQKKLKAFFKHLSQKVKTFLQQLSSLDVSVELAVNITKVIEMWVDEKMFAVSFAEKLKLAAQPLYNKVAEEKTYGKFQNKFTKYKKTFLMEMHDIKQFQPTSRILETYLQMTDLNAKITVLNQAYNKFQFDHQGQDDHRRAEELLRMIEDSKEKLQQIMCCYHRDFKLLANSCKEEYSTLSNEKS